MILDKFGTQCDYDRSQDESSLCHREFISQVNHPSSGSSTLHSYLISICHCCSAPARNSQRWPGCIDVSCRHWSFDAGPWASQKIASSKGRTRSASYWCPNCTSQDGCFPSTRLSQWMLKFPIFTTWNMEKCLSAPLAHSSTEDKTVSPSCQKSGLNSSHLRSYRRTLPAAFPPMINTRPSLVHTAAAWARARSMSATHCLAMDETITRNHECWWSSYNVLIHIVRTNLYTFIKVTTGYWNTFNASLYKVFNLYNMLIHWYMYCI